MYDVQPMSLFLSVVALMEVLLVVQLVDLVVEENEMVLFEIVIAFVVVVVDSVAMVVKDLVGDFLMLFVDEFPMLYVVESVVAVVVMILIVQFVLSKIVYERFYFDLFIFLHY